jgi:hypothetical protein
MILSVKGGAPAFRQANFQKSSQKTRLPSIVLVELSETGEDLLVSLSREDFHD